MATSDSSSDDGFLNLRRYKRQIRDDNSDESAENQPEPFNSTSKHHRKRTAEQESESTSRPQMKTQTKLTKFFPRYKKKPIAAECALKGTPYHGLNVSTKNEYDALSISEIKQELQNCQTILDDKALTHSLPDHGKRIKHKIQLLDEALIRVKARKIIRDKNAYGSVKQNLNFNAIGTRNHNAPTTKTKITYRNLNTVTTERDRNYSAPVSCKGSAKHLDKNSLKDLINSIHSLSIHPTNENQKDLKSKYKIPKELNATLYPHQIEGVEWMIERETHCIKGQPLGGIVADEMGLGKTMQMIALMLHPHKIQSDMEGNGVGFKRSECTLIVCPLSVMSHWENEIRRYTKKGKLITYKYHGINRLKDIQRLTTNYNVIITTYGCIQSEWNEWRKLEDARLNEIKEIRKQVVMLQRHERRYGVCEGDASASNVTKLKKLKMKLHALTNKKYTKHILSQIFWKRIVLDEAHQIKNHKSKTHKAICDITSKCYWFMTATPIQNSLDDLYAAFHFLRYKYYSNYANWKQGISNHSKGIQRIQTLLSVVMLRRLKSDYIQSTEEEEKKENTRTNNIRIQLPPKKAVTHLIEFTSYERFIYNQLSSLMNKIFCGYQQNNSVGKHFSQCLKMLLQLRQSCNSLLLIQNSVHRIHSILNKNENGTNNMDISQLLSVVNGNHKNKALQCSDVYMEEIKSALASGNDECPICLDMIENVSITVCGHRFCTACLEDIILEKEAILQKTLKTSYSSQQPVVRIECPICRTKLKRSNITRVINRKEKELRYERNDRLTQPSSKVNKLMEILCDLHETEPKAKCVVFSQWTSMLDIIENELERNRYGYCRLDGKMSVQKRNKSIYKLNHDARCWVMLISLKAGGVGLNLVAANHVIMTDIWWNPAIEDQAFDRVHRIGQTKNVTIHRIVIGDSVEQKVLKLQEKKRKIAQQALNGNNDKNKNKKKQSVNLSARDLIDLFRE